MGKWMYIDGKAKFFASGKEFVEFLKERIAKYNEKKEQENG